MEVGIENKGKAKHFIPNIFLFELSDKLKFSIKVSLSMALSFLIPFAMGWPQASTAATTIMLIAAIGSVNESVNKGAMRVLGTLIGAAIGMTLIAFFPQDRMLYLAVLSIFVTIILYLLRAYKGDPTIFMLTAMMMLMVFKNGEVDDVFIYGVDRTYMTVFGIIIYTIVGVFLWPVHIQDNSEESASELSSVQLELFLKRDAKKEERMTLQEELRHKEQLLESATVDVRTASMNMGQWHNIIYNYKNINELLTLLSIHDKEDYADDLPLYVTNYKKLEEEISLLLKKISTNWNEKEEITIPDSIKPAYQSHTIKSLNHLERASLLTMIQNMQKLHDELRVLALKLNSLNSPMPTFFALEEIPKRKRFLWGNIEHIKGALVTFLVFWAATFLWINVNLPGGFMIVTLATVLSVLTTFTPVKPSMLIIVLTVSFIFATLMYIFVLPSLHYSWELGLFIFIYSFISFYLINPKMTIFFLLGLFVFGLSNEMQYNFSFFLLTLLMFYLFLIILHVFYYIPFSARPEHLFMILKRRFFIFSQKLLQFGRENIQEKSSIWTTLMARYSNAQLMKTVEDMRLWGEQLDLSYFNAIDKDVIINFTKESERFAYLLDLLYHRDLKMKNNPLLKYLSTEYNTMPSLYDLLEEYASGKEVKKINSIWNDEKIIVKKAEESLDLILSSIDIEAYSKEIIVELYENLSLRRNVWLSFFSCKTLMEKIDFNVLKRNRF